MEKVTEFFKNPKKTASLGLIFCVILVLLKTYSLINYAYASTDYVLYFFKETSLFIGLTIYFIIILISISSRKVNVNIANNLLIVFVTISAIFSFIPFIGTNSIIFFIENIVFIMFLYNIFYNKFNFINNIIFTILIISYTIYTYILPIITSSYINLSSYEITHILAYLSFIPYFYNYYNSVKKGNETNSKEFLEYIGVIRPNTSGATSNIDKDTRRDIYALFCKEISTCLKAPATAVFCKEEELQIIKQNGIYYISGWVDSQNSFGAMIRTNINNFKIKDENGILMIKSNSKIMASNSFVKFFAANWFVSLIFTLISFGIIYAIISSL